MVEKEFKRDKGSKYPSGIGWKKVVKEFNLSEWIVTSQVFPSYKAIDVNNIKEFIKLLKFYPYMTDELEKYIDKKAGDKLC